ncbi:type II toxin-antitoxin system ParD family antitoxin [Iningainema tapete]|uniref:Type II toxin-antitoxin system ParD family antitoxin n=1 Tax=Iningainema tapete BLCC-T55 TaxID=2748662 RepID=A0A8J6XQC3_9CYAN|nr:type II toxin-antitoxin system ParD family antitoxin [Iningainema tapete]MBD2776275.1 type II toxin-antitoxin system ParD family antitoxin [Iningainema tapete BLCC-T55]
MNVSLTPELEQFVQQKVSSGLYNSASEVVREALRLLREQDILRQHHLEELRREIALGIEQADRGQTKPFDAEDLKIRVMRAVSAQEQGQPTQS